MAGPENKGVGIPGGCHAHYTNQGAVVGTQYYACPGTCMWMRRPRMGP